MFWSRKKMRLMHWLGRVVNVGDSMAPEFRLIQTVALFTAVALFSPAWAEPEKQNYFDKYDNQTPVQTPEEENYYLKKYGLNKPREPEAPRYREVPLGPGPHVLIIAKRDGAMTRMNYRSGRACQLARDSVRKQAEPPPGVIQPIGREPTLTAVCVPQ